MRDKLEKLNLALEQNRELLTLNSGFNQFDVLGITNTEIRHSRMLYWLFNTKETHGLNDAFVRAFFDDLPNVDWSSFSVKREYSINSTVTKNGKQHTKPCYIDLSLKSKKHKIIIIIENKVYSSVHSDNNGITQLEYYKAYFDSKDKRYSNYKKIYYLLSPVKDKYSYSGWRQIDYRDIDRAISTIDMSNADVSVKSFLDSYVKVVKRVYMQKELDKLCRDIYKENEEAIDFLMKHTGKGAIISSAIHDVLEKRSANDEIIYLKNKQTVYHYFYSNKMDNFIYGKQFTGKRVSDCVYKYSIDLNDDKDKIGASILLEPVIDKKGKLSVFNSNERYQKGISNNQKSCCVYTAKYKSLKDTPTVEVYDKAVKIVNDLIDNLLLEEQRLIAIHGDN